MEENPLVSCLCITRRRVPMLRLSVAFFLRQTYPAKEMIIACEDDDVETIAFVTALREDRVRLLVCPRTPKLSIGRRREQAVQQARGDYVAVWDDDDWSSPERLMLQIEAIRSSRFSACVLARVMILDRLTGAAYVGETRTWECTMVCKTSDMPTYPDADLHEDIAVINALKARDMLGILDAPSQYVYTYHGTNIGSRIHFRRRIFGPATALPPATAKRISALVANPDAPGLSARELEP